MVSIIKNQLLKHLSRFTKNLSADKINLSTFKGEGELSNLELDVIVLTDLLELPSFLRLTKAWCNKVSFRIPWTKLKSVPIHLNLDEITITLETCEELRSLSMSGSLSSYAAVPGKYSFIHKVIDGITVTVNNVNVVFNSPAFTASVQISRIVLESKSPKWENSDLRMTKVKDLNKGQLLIFKELEWQTVKIEAKSTNDKNLTPLRLITNQARCRIVIKKRLSDCFVLGSRLVIILEDLLWVLTDSQLKAALHFVDSLSDLVKKATQTSRKAKAARKLEELPEYQAQVAQEARSKDIPTSRLFSANDVIETSYHFLSNQIVLHLCDDPGAGRSSHPNLKDGGALQINVRKFQIDYYPYHLVRTSRNHWPKYNESAVPHTLWQEQALSAFKTRLMDLINKGRQPHVPLTRSPKLHQDFPNSNQSSPELKKTFSSPSSKDVRKRIENQFGKLMTTCVILRLDDFILYKVATSGKKQPLKEFISGDRDHMMLPKDASILHAEFIYYYYPNDIPFPLPPPKFYVQMNPIQVVFDVNTALWINSFGLNLYKSLMASNTDVPVSNYTYIDVKIESILPRINFESNLDYPGQKDRPKVLSFQVTRAILTNVRSLEQSSRADLAKCVDSFHMGSLFFGSEFPSQPNDFCIVTQKFLDHISARDNIRALPDELSSSTIEALEEQLSREVLWTDAKDLWCVNLDPVWGDFFGARAVGINKSVPFLDTIPVVIWLHSHMDPNSTIKQGTMENDSQMNADIHALVHISNLISVQINHYQFLFVLRLAEEIAEMATFISIDSNRILKVESSGSIVLGALIPQLEVTFVMPSQCPGKESSGGDVESFVPDSSSLADELFVGSTNTVWKTSNLSMTHMDGNKISMANGAGASLDIPTSHSMDFDDQFLAKNALYPNSSTTQQPTSYHSKVTLQNNINEGFSSMKKGFSNFMSSFESAIKPNDDGSDSLSVRSDSSDSENFIMVMNEEQATSDLMFSSYNTGIGIESDIAPPFVEMASEVIEEDSTITSISGRSATSSCRRKDVVSVSTFKVNKVEFLQQSLGYSSTVKVQVGNIVCEDCNSIPWDEFQNKFSSRTRAWSENPLNSGTSPTIKLRLDHFLMLPTSVSMMELDFRDKENLKKLFRDMLTIKVSDLSLDLSMSTVTGLADLVEDEILLTPLPIQIMLDNVQICLNEDRPPVNITSPGSVPIDLNISQLYITRSEDGIFHILPTRPDCRSSLSSLNSGYDGHSSQKLNKQLLLDNEELRRRLAAFERVSEENRELRLAKEEKEVLKGCLTAAQDEVMRLLEEKKKLLDDINVLQEQKKSDKGRQWNTKR